MSFLAPWLLGLAGLAAVPILVHFLRQRITTRVDFPAARLLVAAERDQRRERVLRHRALLILRVLAVLLLALAIARPLLRLFGGAHAPVAVALLLDTSPSTARVANGATVFDGLRDAARAVLDRLDDGDRVWILATDGRTIAGTREEVRRELAALTPSLARGDLRVALTRAAALAGAATDRVPVVALLHDGQRSALDSLGAAVPSPVLLLTPPPAPAPQRAVLAARPEPVRWAPGGRVAFTVVAPVPTPWRALLGDRTVARGVAGESETTTTPSMADGTVLEVAARVTDDGWTAGRIEVDAGGLPADDRRWFAVLGAPAPRIRVDASAGPFLTAAVRTLESDGRVRGPDGVGGNVVYVASADAALPARAPRLLVAPRDPLRIAAANRALAASGVPWRFGARRTDTALVQERTAKAGETAPDPSTTAATDRWRGARVSERFVLEPAPDAPADAAAEVTLTAGGRPLVVRGDGWVLVGAAIDPGVTDLPLRAAFVPWLLGELVTHLGGEGRALAVAPGDSVAWPGGVDGWRVLASDGDSAPPADGRARGTGVYVARRADRDVGALVVNVDPRESDAMQWSRDEVVALWRGTTIDMAADAEALAAAVVRQPGGFALDLPLAALGLLALFGELLLSRGLFAGAAGPAAAPAAAAPLAARPSVRQG